MESRTKVLRGARVALVWMFSLLTAGWAHAQSLNTPPRVSVALGWSASYDYRATGYMVHYGLVGGTVTNLVDAGPALTATVTNLDLGVNVFFYVTAYDANRVQSDPSNLITYVPVAPVAPANLTAAPLSSHAVSLAWQRTATNLDGYYIERSLDGTNFVKVATVGASVTSAVVGDTNLTLSAWTYPYWFRACAFKDSVVSPYSNFVLAESNRADLVIDSVAVSPAAPVAGQSVTFQAVLRNQGSGATLQGVNVKVSFSVDGTTPIAYGLVTNSLAPAATALVTGVLSTNGVPAWTALAGLHSILATVDLMGAQVESNPTNNTLKMAIPVPAADAPTVQLSLNKTSVLETDPVGALVTLTRSGSTNAPQAVNLALGGTAKPGRNYLTPATLVVIPAGQSTVTLPLFPVSDRLVAPNSVVTLNLVADQSYQIGTSSSVALTIVNTDVDSDGDGMSDAAEVLAGTNPYDRNSNLKISSFKRGPGGVLTLTWVSVPGVTYRVLCRPGLADGDWTGVSQGIVATANSTSFNVPTNGPSCVYGLSVVTANGL